MDLLRLNNEIIMLSGMVFFQDFIPRKSFLKGGIIPA
jgi:hypothetical protein